jgi:hypothetical protein
VLAAASDAALHRGDFSTALERAEASQVDVVPGAPGSLLPYVATGSALIFAGRTDEAVIVMEDAKRRFDAANTSDYERWNLLAVLAIFRATSSNPSGARAEAEESLRLARRIGNPSGLAIALCVHAIAVLPEDPALAVMSSDESRALTESGASDVMYTIANGTGAAARAVLGDRRGALELTREGIRHSFEQRDRSSLNYVLSFGIAPTMDSFDSELALACAWALQGFSAANDLVLEVGERAAERARELLGDDDYRRERDAIEALTFDETIERVLLALDAQLSRPE